MAGPTGNAHQFLNLALCDGLAGRKANNRPHTLRPNVRSGVKTGKAQCEPMFSALPPRADIAQRSRHVRSVPEADISHTHSLK